MKNIKKISNLAVIGLGYVGLPLAVNFAMKKNVVGFDIDKKRINELNHNIDRNLDFNKKDLSKIKTIKFSSEIKDLKNVNCYIICTPTPITKLKKPNLKPLLDASRIVGKVMKIGDLVIYESTVYPGCTEEKCVPILEKNSGLKFNKDFFCGYSPERINPGDKKNVLSKVKKITSGSTPKISNIVDKLYNQIIKAGTFKASSIKIAEAAKIIENSQRDINIAFINEISILLNKLNIDTKEVLEAAETKWNFLSFKPGMVGGHCIGVDPYYLTYRAKLAGYKPNIILSGRKINNYMAKYIVSQFVNKMKIKSIQVKKAKVLIMGLTFKENTNDIRNSGSLALVKELKKLDIDFDLYDLKADNTEVKNFYGVYPIEKLIKNKYNGIILAVAHDYIKKINYKNILKLCKKKHIIYDLKYIFPKKVKFRL